MTDAWLDGSAVAARLAIKPQPLYAYVSRGRIAGWIAHAREQVISGRLIRPSSHYVGPMPRAAA